MSEQAAMWFLAAGWDQLIKIQSTGNYDIREQLQDFPICFKLLLNLLCSSFSE